MKGNPIKSADPERGEPVLVLEVADARSMAARPR